MDRNRIVQLLAQVNNQEITNEEFLNQIQEEGVDRYNISLEDLQVRFVDSSPTEPDEECVHLLHKDPSEAENNLVMRLLKKAGVNNYDVSLRNGEVKYFDNEGEELTQGIDLWRQF